MACCSAPAPKRCSAVARDPRHLGAEIGFFSVLHTWNQHSSIIHMFTASFRPVVWLPITPAGLVRRLNSSSCSGPQPSVPWKFVAGLRQPTATGSSLSRSTGPPADAKAFAALLRSLFRSDCVVHSKRPFGGAEHVLHYRAHTDRIAISNHRLVLFADGVVTFRWRESARKTRAFGVLVRRRVSVLLLSTCAAAGLRAHPRPRFLAHRRVRRCCGAAGIAGCHLRQGVNRSPPEQRRRTFPLWKCPSARGPWS